MVRSTLPSASASAPAPARETTELSGTTSDRLLAPLARAAGRTFELWLPPVLLVLSWVVGAIASFTWLEGEAFRWSLLPAVPLLVLRLALERTLRRTGPDSRPLRAMYGLHLLLTAAATVTNPMTCIYTFSGYIDSARFLQGGRSRAVVVATALLSAVGQVGGVGVVAEETGFFLGLAAVNLMIASGMMFLAEERESALASSERALAETLQVQRENERLHGRLLEGARRAGADEERTRLSREIHDTVAQGLVGVIRQLEAVGEECDPAARHRLAVAEEAARDSLLETRRAVEALGPHQLHDKDLHEALSGLVARWSRTHRVVATLDADDAPRHVRHGDVLLRIAQEALANVARHAEACTVAVTLLEDGEHQMLQVRDDGVGFEPEEAPRGHGLANMEARVRAIGGHLTVVSEFGAGTTVRASVPR